MSDKQPLRRKHIPTRMCVACRNKFEKRHLTRIVYVDGKLQIDATGKQNGRGAYLCTAPACWQRAAKSNLLDHALRVSLTNAEKQVLQERFSS